MNDTEWLASFASALKRSDIDAASALFADECYWRDLVAFTWNIVTLESRSAISDMLKTRLSDVQPDSFVLEGRPGWFTFETAQGRGKGESKGVSCLHGRSICVCYSNEAHRRTRTNASATVAGSVWRRRPSPTGVRLRRVTSRRYARPRATHPVKTAR